MYLGKQIGKFKAVDNADLVVTRAAAKETEPMPVEPVIVEKTVYVEVEKIVEVPVPVAVAAEPESVFFGDTVPAEWVEQTVKS